MAPNVDHYNREITYLRISVTDRCNLRCLYCMPAQHFRLLAHAAILTFEEIIQIVEAATALGIKKIRFTGGDPLIRKGFVDLLRSVCSLPGLEDVSVTTNGVLLKRWARDIFRAGVHRINVSLDSFDPHTFKKITGRDAFYDVLDGIEEAEAIGFSPIRINVVVIHGINEKELAQFARLSIQKPYQIRFIEYMPIGNDHRWTPDKFISTQTIMERLEVVGPLQKVPRSALDGPAERYRFSGAKGEIGLISPLSRHFCPTCNRMRLTADGKLRPCLFADAEVDIKTALREGAGGEEIQKIIKQAIDSKPKQHYATKGPQNESSRPMTAIGG